MPVSTEHCPSARSVAFSAATFLGSRMLFDGGYDLLALQGAEIACSRQLLLYVFSVADVLSTDPTKLVPARLGPPVVMGAKFFMLPACCSSLLVLLCCSLLLLVCVGCYLLQSLCWILVLFMI